MTNIVQPITYVEQLCDLYHWGDQPTGWDYARIAGVVLLTCTVAIPIIAFFGAFIADCCCPPHSTPIAPEPALEMLLTEAQKKDHVRGCYYAIRNHICNIHDDIDFHRSKLVDALQLSNTFFQDDLALLEAIAVWWPREEGAAVVDEYAISLWLAKRNLSLDAIQALGMIDPNALQRNLTALSIIMHLDTTHPREEVTLEGTSLLQLFSEE